MTVVHLDDDDLDDEDRAVLAEVASKGYYHGRPKNEACQAYAPTKLEQPPPPPPLISDTSQCASFAPRKPQEQAASRAAFDDFQRKWDRFDCDAYVDEVEAATLMSKELTKGASSSSSSKAKPAVAVPAKPATHIFKVLLAGSKGVGKTALLKRHTTGEFNQHTMWFTLPTKETGCDVLFTTNCGELRFHVMEMREPSPRPINKLFDAVILMYDLSQLSNVDALEALQSWGRALQEDLSPRPVVVVGNKADAAEREGVRLADLGLTGAAASSYQHYCVSAQSRHDIEKPFLWLSRMLTNQPKLAFAKPLARQPSDSYVKDKATTEDSFLLRLAVSRRIPSGE